MTPDFTFISFWWRHQLIASALDFIYARVYHLSFGLCFFAGVFLSSRVTGAYPVTTDLIMRVNVRTTKNNISYVSTHQGTPFGRTDDRKKALRTPQPKSTSKCHIHSLAYSSANNNSSHAVTTPQPHTSLPTTSNIRIRVLGARYKLCSLYTVMYVPGTGVPA